MLIKNSVYKAEFTDINNLGCGVCRIDGVVVFVDGAVDGDVADIKIIKVAKNYCVGRIERLITPSPHRIEPDCPVSKRCGGCSYRHITYEHELDIKRRYIEGAFAKAGVECEIDPVISAGEINGYRNKAAYPVSANGKTGFYARRTHDIISCDVCRLGHPAFDEIASAFRAWLEKSGCKTAKHLYIRRGFATNETMVCVVSSSERLPKKDELIEAFKNFDGVKSIFLNVNPEDTNVILGDRYIKLWGDDFIEDILCGLRFRISPQSFYPVNRNGAELLYGQVFKRVAELNPSNLLDLYCGAGTIGLSIAARFPGISLTGVEIVPKAIENAKHNAAANGIENVHFICGDATDAGIGGFDCIVTDPPRKGMSKELVDKIVAEKPRNIVYVSCSPDTLARDAALLIAGGYRIGRVSPVDMFPRTGSLEAVAMFSLK